MANPNDPPASKAQPAPEIKWIKVRAKLDGTSAAPNGRHYYRDRGTVFEVHPNAYTAEWMIKCADDKTAELPPDLPDTSLPQTGLPRRLSF